MQGRADRCLCEFFIAPDHCPCTPPGPKRSSASPHIVLVCCTTAHYTAHYTARLCSRLLATQCRTCEATRGVFFHARSSTCRQCGSLDVAGALQPLLLIAGVVVLVFLLGRLMRHLPSDDFSSTQLSFRQSRAAESCRAARVTVGRALAVVLVVRKLNLSVKLKILYAFVRGLGFKLTTFLAH